MYIIYFYYTESILSAQFNGHTRNSLQMTNGNRKNSSLFSVGLIWYKGPSYKWATVMLQSKGLCNELMIVGFTDFTMYSIFLEAVSLIEWLECPVRKSVKASVQGKALVELGLGHYPTRCSICTELMSDVWHFVCMALLDLMGPGQKKKTQK